MDLFNRYTNLAQKKLNAEYIKNNFTKLFTCLIKKKNIYTHFFFLFQHLAEDMNLDTDADWTQILDNQPIVLNDRMMTDAVQSPHIQSEHSYSLTLNDELNPQSPFGHNIKLEDYGKGRIFFLFNSVNLFPTWISLVSHLIVEE